MEPETSPGQKRNSLVVSARALTILLFSGVLLAQQPSAVSILTTRCANCHGAAAMSGLDVRSRQALLKGGARGASIIPGKSAESPLIQAVLRTGEIKMPPGKEGLPENEIRILRDWVDGGAKWEAADAKPAAPSWWSFRTPIVPAVPPVSNPAWVRNPIDAFILSKLDGKSLKPVREADKLTLLRRATFDLHGLPPTAAQANEFLSDRSATAYEKLIDQLLASPRYGERWGRHWLDAARYADSGGYENDLHYWNAWRYRDYVIKSLNDDKPYNQFVQEQIAADEIWPDNLDLAGIYELAPEKKKHLEGRIGTGLYTVGSWFPAAGLIPDYLRAERLGDMVDVTGSLFMGLSFGCAKCHDHKFEPIPQRDYYRIQAIFAASEEQEIPVVDIMKVIDYQKHLPRVLVLEDLKEAVNKLAANARKRIMEEAGKDKPKLTEEMVIERMTAEERANRDALLRKIGETYLPYPGRHPTASVLGHVERVPDIHIALRGEWTVKGEKVTPGLPSALSDGAPLANPRELRKQLALWLTRPNHPLTSRVMVNRVWQGHFGWGIVRTPNDFGRQGEAPTHPELLDWLASEFMAKGWSMKAMHKLIMTSSTYRLANSPDERNTAIDPDNRLLWRANRRRLEAEAVRDAILSASGALNLQMYGPPVAPPLSDEEMDGNKDDYKWPATIQADKASRRSVYLYNKRAFKMPLFDIFDAPDTTVSCARRDVTNVAPQALALLNNRFVLEQAGHFAERLRREGGTNETQVRRAWEVALSRPPTQPETLRALRLLAGTPDAHFRLALLIFNLNEFVYVD